MYRWLRFWWRLGCVFGLWAVLAGVGARANAIQYEVTLRADGGTIGTASGTVEVGAAPDGRLTWKLTDGKFTASAPPGSTISWDDANLSGSGSVEAGASVTLKEFEVTVKQSSGVDVAYRFRFSVEMDAGAVKSVAVTQIT